jgi:gliding motility-associated-like protein
MLNGTALNLKKNLRLPALVSILLLGALSSYAQPSAQFTSNITSGCVPLIVNFTDQSTGGPTSWFWEFGNGITSNNQNPTATYFNSGFYTVRLTVTNASGSNTITKTNYISVFDKPVVNFTVNDSSGCYPKTLQFTDLTNPGSGTNASWLWDFGDGTFSTQQNPSHRYTSGGNFNVTLQVTNSNGCINSFTKIGYIQLNTGIVPAFTNSVATTCAPPSNISFTNTTTGPPTLSYAWQFGDGGLSNQQNPSYIYTTPGLFTVTLIVTSTAGCSDTLRKVNSVAIQNIVSVINGPDTVCVNTPTTFINGSAPRPPNTVWAFGDGGAGSGDTVTHIYGTTGTFTMRMTNTFSNCVDSAIKTIVVVAKPIAAFSSANQVSCRAPHTVNFTNTSTGGASWFWIFGDGGTSTLQNPSHTYNNTGQFNVTLIVTNASGCKDTLHRVNFVRILPPNLAVANLPDEGCVPYPFAPINNVFAVDGVASYFWDFGNGNTSTLPNPSTIYNTVGTYKVRLIITTNGGCTDSLVYNAGVRVGNIPTPDFTASPTTVCAFQPVTFTDLSSSNVDTWDWDFGDGNSSASPSPVYSYQDTGVFTVSLTVKNNGCARTLTRTNYITVLPPIARFRDSTDCTNRRRKFFINESIAGVTFSWNFGDNNTSNQQNPIHTYATTGTYTVTLTVTNGSCTHTIQQQVRVIVEQANFTTSTQLTCRKSPVTFTAIGNNTNDIGTYTWNLGDGTIFAGSPRTHAYQAAGVYTITLVATDINGCSDTLVRPNYITVYGAVPDFSSNNNTGCQSQSVIFNDLTLPDGVNQVTQWSWNFGDGPWQNFSGPPFSHQYAAPGTYTVSLAVRDAAGCTDTITKNDFVRVSAPKAGFTVLDSLGCPNSVFQFVDTSSGNPRQWEWNFGDNFTSPIRHPSHLYALPGLYTVKLVVTDSLGCRDSIIKPNYIRVDRPVANFTMSDSVGQCPPLQVNFTFTGSYARNVRWDFGDNTFSTLLNPSHFYSIPGVYFPKLTVTSPGGCQDTLRKRVEVFGPFGVLSYNPLTGCAPHTVNFAVQTNGVVNNILWDFSDGNTISTADTVVTNSYAGGKWLPRIILRDPSGCLVPIIGTDTIFVEDLRVDFDADKRFGCDSLAVRFSDSTKRVGPVTYRWDFGDGNFSTQANPVHTYRGAGFYDVKLVVRSSYGCIDSIIKPRFIKIDATPNVNIFGDTSECEPANIQLQAIIDVGDTSTVNWLWKFDSGTTSTLQTLNLSYPNAGVYGVTLVGTTLSGCVDSVRRNIRIHPIPVVDAGRDTVMCLGTPVQLQATGALTYFWLPPSDGTLSCNTCAAPLANPPRDTLYVVRGRTIFGCEAQDTVLVRVLQRPVLVVQPSVFNICIGNSAQLQASGAQRYLWSPAGTLNNPTIFNPRATPIVNTVYTVVATDSLGCFTDSANVTVNVLARPTVNAGPDQTIVGGTSATINTTVSGGVTGYNWLPSNTLSCGNCPAPVATPRTTTNYIVRVTGPGGCVASDTVTIFVTCGEQNFFIPNTFSPNGDGMNDVFYPRGRGIQRIRSMTIFNRWGERVYEKREFAVNDPSLGWNGRVNGKQATSDVYTYVIEIICENNLVIPYRGNVTLIY